MTADHLGIDHLGLTVSDLDASARFFIDGLGWTRFGGNPDYPAIYVTNGHAKLTLWQQKGDDLRDFDRHANVGLHHVALRVPTREALDRLYDRVCGWPGVAVEFAPELSGAGPKVHFMINEPGGARLEFSYDPR
ncbi:VOC family protein [Psychromarinibacter halotolerans]|uniref:VOC family protein n=1 Tax=Psychromarinibacter halotolerans TaxID=1775175 RepID=A0ABV7GPJ3_9RHOB|nr:VOC family protein [Psychromarinibacter halotolerans]MDF0595349.1 VOC family protein [Psychromarinibacter halotolerans]